MTEALSLYAPRASGVHRLNPLTKLALAGLLLFTGLVLPGAWTTYVLFMLGVLPLALWGQVAKPLLKAAWKVSLPFAVSVFLIQGFLWPRGTPVLWIGPFSLKQEGLFFAASSSGRILMVVGSFLWLALTTRPDHLMTVLTQRGFPAGLAYIVVATIQIAPRLQARAANILDAQRARGLETAGNLGRRLRAILPLVVPLVLSSLLDVEERALAVEARGFNRPGPKTSLVEILEARWEPVLRWTCLLAALAALGARLFL